MSEVTDSTGVDVSKLDKYSVFYLIPLPRRDVLNKSQTDQYLVPGKQSFRDILMHWNIIHPPTRPKNCIWIKWTKDGRSTGIRTVRTDENGKAVIECYNNQYSTPVIIQAETMSKDRQIGSMKYSTIGQAEQ